VYRLLLFTAAASLCLADIPPAVMAERNLEKRSELALQVADESITAASKAYADESAPKFEQYIQSVEELTQLSLKSLHDTGKQARKSPKYFKRAELKLRSLLRRLSTLSNEVSVDDRPRVEATRKVVSEIHEQLLHEIMSKK
jgi:predicted component of type VI protein secretion system